MQSLDCLRIIYILPNRMTFMDRSYQAENARSRPLPEAKLPWASPVVGWVTTCEPDVTICLLQILTCGVILCFAQLCFLVLLLCSQV
jgi:hypothetical protein